jgi:hypothetical protein
MAKFRGLDRVGDWMFGQGLGSYAQDRAALALDIAARLRSIRGNCFFAPTNGVDYKNLLEKGQLKNLETALQSCIIQTPGVVSIVSMPFNFNPATRKLNVGPSVVETIYGQIFLAQINNLLGGPPSA